MRRLYAIVAVLAFVALGAGGNYATKAEFAALEARVTALEVARQESLRPSTAKKAAEDADKPIEERAWEVAQRAVRKHVNDKRWSSTEWTRWTRGGGMTSWRAPIPGSDGAGLWNAKTEHKMGRYLLLLPAEYESEHMERSGTGWVFEFAFFTGTGRERWGGAYRFLVEVTDNAGALEAGEIRVVNDR